MWHGRDLFVVPASINGTHITPTRLPAAMVALKCMSLARSQALLSRWTGYPGTLGDIYLDLRLGY